MKTSDFGCEIEFFYTYKERQPQPGTHFNIYWQNWKFAIKYAYMYNFFKSTYYFQMLVASSLN